MNDLRQAAQQALETLEILDKVMQRSPRTESAITALRAALAEPEQEPVAWADDVGAVIPHSHKLFAPDLCERYTQPLYTAPTTRKPQTTHWEGCEAVHPECKEKSNGS